MGRIGTVFLAPFMIISVGHCRFLSDRTPYGNSAKELGGHPPGLRRAAAMACIDGPSQEHMGSSVPNAQFLTYSGCGQVCTFVGRLGRNDETIPVQGMKRGLKSTQQSSIAEPLSLRSASSLRASRRFAGAFRKDSNGAALVARVRSNALHPHGRLSLRNLPDPESMSGVERCREVAFLLAKGFLRHRLRLVNGAEAAGFPLLVTDPPARFLLASRRASARLPIGICVL